MVVFQIKVGQQDGFLYEASVNDSNDSLIDGLVSNSPKNGYKIHASV